MRYYINSNSGYYVVENDGQYTLNLISRTIMNNEHVIIHLYHEVIPITPSQFHSLKGFIPIKEKKLFNNRQRKHYTPTKSDGSKGVSERIQVPTVSETREEILRKLGL